MLGVSWLYDIEEVIYLNLSAKVEPEFRVIGGNGCWVKAKLHETLFHISKERTRSAF